MSDDVSLLHELKDISTAIDRVLAEQDPVGKVILSSTGSIPANDYLLTVRVGEEQVRMFPKIAHPQVQADVLLQLTQGGILSDEAFHKLSRAAAQVSIDAAAIPEWFPQVRRAGPQVRPEVALPAAHSWKLSGVEVPFQVRTQADLRRAGEWFEARYDALSSTDRRIHATNLVKASRALHFTIPSAFLTKRSAYYAGLRLRPADEAAGILERTRLPFCDTLPRTLQQKTSAAYSAAAAALRQGLGSEDLAEGLDEVDRLSGFSGLPAHEVVYLPYGFDKSSSLDIGELSGRTRMEAGVTYVYEDELERLPEMNVDALRKTFSDDTVDELLKAPVAVYKSLPAPHREQVATLIRQQVGDGAIPPLEA